jgi:hypothetical protein
MKQLPEIPLKKPYQSPKLLVYGNLAQMTRGLGINGRKDGATGTRRVRTG